MAFADFARDTNKMRELCGADHCCAYNPAAKKWQPSFVDEHVNAQAHCMFLPDGSSMVDFVGRSEHVDEDWAELLQHIGRRSGRQVTARPVKRVNAGRGATSAGGAGAACAAQLRPELNETTMRGIAEQYARDVLDLCYLPA